MLLTLAKNHYRYSILDIGISSFCYSSNNNSDRPQHQPYLSESSSPDPNYLQNQESNLDTILKTETKVSPKPPFIKRILLVDDDPDITFKVGLEGHYYGDGDKKKRFEVYSFNDPLLVLTKFKPQFLIFF